MAHIAMAHKVVIVDESHKLRVKADAAKPDAKETAVVLHAAKNARRAILLSGTPLLSKPYDVYHQAIPI